MKFKKDGKVFEDIVSVLDDFRCPGPCNVDCPLYRAAWKEADTPEHPICRPFVLNHPAEAARLMGYEVMEDDHIADDGKKGLYRKYIVTKAYTGEEVTDCFVLRPAKDAAAVEALREYARVTDNKALADDILQWVGEKETDMDKQDKTLPCKWCQDEFCTNADSPMRADYCPVPDTPFVCLHEDRGETQDSSKNITTSEEESQEHKKEVKSELMKQDKLLKDWTLGEVQEYCKDRICGECSHRSSRNKLCRFSEYPSGWDLTEKLRFTEEEVECAKAARVLWPHVICVKKEIGAVMLYGEDGEAIAGIDAGAFPSIHPRQAVKISDIVGGEA